MHKTRLSLLSALLVLACGKRAETEATQPPQAADADGSDSATNAETVTAIRGRVVGHDGKPAALAHVRLVGTGAEEAPEIRVGEDGSFTLDVTQQGLAELEVTAVDHEGQSRLVLLDGAPIEVDVALGTYERPGSPDDIGLMVWTEDPASHPPNQVELTKGADGVLSAEVETDAERVWYQIMGTSGPGRIVNGPSGDAFEYDGGGDYRSVLTTTGGKVHIEVDPKQLPPPGRDGTMAFADGASPSARLGSAKAILERFTDAQNELVEANSNAPAQELQALLTKQDPSAERDELLALVDETDHPALRHALLGMYFSLGSFEDGRATKRDRELAAELLGDMPADDMVWGHFSMSMVSAVELSEDPDHATRLRVLLDEELPTPVAGEVLLSTLYGASLEGDVETAKDIFTRLQAKRFADTPYFFISKQFDPNRAVRAGQPMPAFDIEPLQGKGRVTNEDLTGKVVLVDLWATWCKPCVAEMDNLHATYDKYVTKRKPKKGERKFEILSISLDAKTDDVKGFREDKWPMPWMHGHMEFDAAGELFGVAGIPYAVLVDEKGNIIATSPNINGKSLDRVLDEVLAQPPAG